MGPTNSKTKQSSNSAATAVVQRDNSERLRHVFTDVHFLEHPAMPVLITRIRKGDSMLIVVADDAGAIHIWDATTFLLVDGVPSKGRPVGSLIGMGERFVVVYKGDAATQVYVFSDGRNSRQLQHEHAVWSVNVISESRIVCLCDDVEKEERFIHWWTLSADGSFTPNRQRRSPDDDQLNFRQVIYLGPTAVLAIPMSSYFFMFVYYDTGAEPLVLIESKDPGAVTAACMDTQNQLLLCGTSKGDLKMWARAPDERLSSTPTKQKTLNEGAEVLGITMLSSVDDHARVLVGHTRGFCIVDTESEHIVSMCHIKSTTFVAVIPDVSLLESVLSGHFVVTVSDEGLQIWNTLTPEFLQLLAATRSGDNASFATNLPESVNTESMKSVTPKGERSPKKPSSVRNKAENNTKKRVGNSPQPTFLTPFIPNLESKHAVVTHQWKETLVCVVNDSLIVGVGSAGMYMVAYTDTSARRSTHIHELRGGKFK